MLVIRFTRSQLGAVLAASFALALLPGAADIGNFRAAEAERIAAAGLLLFESVGIGRVTACMVRNKSQLSPQCRAFFRASPESGEAAGDPAAKSHRIKRPRPDDT